MGNRDTKEFRTIMENVEVQNSFRDFLQTDQLCSKHLALFEFWLSCTKRQQACGAEDSALSCIKTLDTGNGYQAPRQASRSINHHFSDVTTMGEYGVMCGAENRTNQYRSNSAPISPHETPKPCTKFNHHLSGNSHEIPLIQGAQTQVEHFLSSVVYPQFVNSAYVNRLVQHSSSTCTGFTSDRTLSEPNNFDDAFRKGELPTKKMQSAVAKGSWSVSPFSSSPPHSDSDGCRQLAPMDDMNSQQDISEWSANNPGLPPSPVSRGSLPEELQCNQQVGCSAVVDMPGDQVEVPTLHPKMASFSWAQTLFAHVAREYAAGPMQPESILDDHLARVWPKRACCMILEDRRHEGECRHRTHRARRLHRLAHQSDSLAYRRLDEDCSLAESTTSACCNGLSGVHNRQPVPNDEPRLSDVDRLQPQLSDGIHLEALGSRVPITHSAPQSYFDRYCSPHCRGCAKLSQLKTAQTLPNPKQCRSVGICNTECGRRLPQGPEWKCRCQSQAWSRNCCTSTWLEMIGPTKTVTEHHKLNTVLSSACAVDYSALASWSVRSASLDCIEEFYSTGQDSLTDKALDDLRPTSSYGSILKFVHEKAVSTRSKARMKRKRSGSDSRAPQGLCVVCQLPGVRRPYVTYWQSNVISLRHYKGLIITLQRRAAKLLNKELPQLQAYRYFFKCESTDFPPGVVYQECCNDEAFVPQWRGIVWGKMELNESSPS